jgi:LacI family transcriptional regulator
LAYAGLDPEQAQVLAGDFRETAGCEAGARILASRPRPTAVFAANDCLAIGLLAALSRAGCSVPADIAVVGFDDVAIARYLNPALTTVHVDACGMGRQAVEIMLRAMEAGHHAAPVQQVMPAVLKIRQSCGSFTGREGEGASAASPRRTVVTPGKNEGKAANKG